MRETKCPECGAPTTKIAASASSEWPLSIRDTIYTYTPPTPSSTEREADWLILEVGMEPPKHECEFITNPEKGACEFHERWVSAYETGCRRHSCEENE